jgi:hypothetical protein
LFALLLGVAAVAVVATSVALANGDGDGAAGSGACGRPDLRPVPTPANARDSDTSLSGTPRRETYTRFESSHQQGL